MGCRANRHKPKHKLCIVAGSDATNWQGSARFRDRFQRQSGQSGDYHAWIKAEKLSLLSNQSRPAKNLAVQDQAQINGPPQPRFNPNSDHPISSYHDVASLLLPTRHQCWANRSDHLVDCFALLCFVGVGMY